MTTMTRWNPFKEMDNLQQQVSSLANLTPSRNGNGTAFDWMPHSDVIEDKDGYVIALELPGVHRDDVKLTLENGTLSISGERRAPEIGDNSKRHLRERFHGRFERRFTLPDIVETENINASLKDGVLTVHIAKREMAKPRQIEIEVK